MSNTIRIRTEPNGNDKYLKVKLEQDWDFIEILSLKISQEDAYIKFCSDYGAIVGRVVINSGFGVPNAKVSVFIPLDDIDKNDPLISGLYPFEVITDKDSDGIRYNLFPKDNASTNDCYSPIGTFPNKREVLDNDTLLSVYCKYYKFTTTTNHAGDFMIFGVPLGTYMVHVDADISDIGIASQRPYDLISQGTSEKLFQSPTKFKTDTNLDSLIQVKTLNSSVNVQPFWGDTENCEIGISRLDFDLNLNITPAAIFMGSIYGDQDRHSINKHCRPRNKMGLLCHQTVGPGTVDMIRKTIDGQIEEFTINGGRVIDDDGTWAYQIPMNLDYMVTDEEGNLILSQDPNKGIPTRARVRFKIGMDETGGEGRLRTRAKYLIPNNPTQQSEVDYTFDETTKDTSFRDLHWNKIYSISNYISRFQKHTTLQPEKTRNITAIKDVDGCGDKSPHPYNRVNGQTNPIFFILCLIINIITFLIVVLNGLVFRLINIMIGVINTIFSAILGVLNSIISAFNSIGITISTIPVPHIPYIPCITIPCGDNGETFAPGCSTGTLGYGATVPAPTFSGDDTGLANCIAFEMAKALDMFQFDFYNDWINGSLYGYLLKYKKKRRGREVFCEYDCSDYGIADGGVDGNNNGVPDNNCQNNLLMDSCFPSPNLIPFGEPDWQHGHKDNGGMRDGLIKKVGDEFFYAATTHDLRYKLFATELINLGSVFNCDWQGLPNIQPLLIPTSYKIPPEIVELDDNGNIETTGIVQITNNAEGLFFTIDCVGLHVDQRECLNLRHICEMGVNIDETIEDPRTGDVASLADGMIGSRDIDEDRGTYFRDVFLGLNNTPTPWISINNITLPYSSDFNTNLPNDPKYDFASVNDSSLGHDVNGPDYINFRGYSAGQFNFGQTKHSYFFYFGLLPGKTALDKMNQRFFTTCKLVTRDNFLIQASATVSNNSDGTLTFTFIGGSSAYTYTVTSSVLLAPIVGTTNSSVTLTGLDAGTYLITAFDSLGTPVHQTVVVSGPPALYCYVSVTQNATSSSANDGVITISAVGGGQAPYNYVATTYLGAVISSGTLLVPQTITGLAIDNTHGYVVTVTDSSTPISACTTTGLTVNGPTVIIISVTSNNSTCFSSNDGSIDLGVTGGQSPYTITTVASGGFSSHLLNLSGLAPKTYTTTVVDSLGTTATQATTIISPQRLLLTMASSADLAKQCDSTQYIIPFMVTLGIVPGPAHVSYQVNNDGIWHSVTPILTYVNPSTLMYVKIPSGSVSVNVKIRLSDSTGTCFSDSIDSLDIPKAAIALPSVVLTCNVTTTGSGPYTHVITGSGGIAPYTGTVTVTDSNPTYHAIITDSVGCTATHTG
jgi:hypothetical protein